MLRQILQATLLGTVLALASLLFSTPGQAQAAVSCPGQFVREDFVTPAPGIPGSGTQSCSDMPDTTITTGEDVTSSVRWVGTFTFPAGDYTFRTVHPGGAASIYVVPGTTWDANHDGIPDVSATSPDAARPLSGTYTVVVEYRHLGGTFAFQSWWEATGCPSGVAALYYSSPDLTGIPGYSACEPGLPDINGGPGYSPHSLLPPDAWSAEWRIQDVLLKRGEYEFSTRADGVQLWLTPDGQAEGSPVIDATGDTAVTDQTAPLAVDTANWSAATDPTFAYDIRLVYRNAGGQNRVKLWWETTACPDWRFRTQYYNSTAWNEQTPPGEPVFATCESTLPDHAWGSGSPHPWVNSDNFSVAYAGSFAFAKGTYRFKAYVDDGVRLYARPAGTGSYTPVLDYWEATAPVTRTSDPWLSDGGSYDLQAIYYEDGGTSDFKFWWEAENCPLGEYAANYYNVTSTNKYRPAMGQPVNWATCTTLPQNWGTGSPSPWVGDVFYASLKGTFRFKEAGYTFTGTADDGMRAYLGADRVIDRWDAGPGSSTSAPVQVAGDQPLLIEYTDKGGAAALSLAWNQASCLSDDWTARYYGGEAIEGDPVYVACEAMPDYAWRSSPTWVAAPFSVSWSRSGVALEPGQYGFEAAPGSNRLFVAGGQSPVYTTGADGDPILEESSVGWQAGWETAFTEGARSAGGVTGVVANLLDFRTATKLAIDDGAWQELLLPQRTFIRQIQATYLNGLNESGSATEFSIEFYDGDTLEKAVQLPNGLGALATRAADAGLYATRVRLTSRVETTQVAEFAISDELIDNMGAGAEQTAYGVREMQGDANVLLEYANVDTAAGATALRYAKLDEAPAPASRCPDGTYLAEYFRSPTPTGKADFATCEARAAIGGRHAEWGGGRPSSWITSGADFSVRWSSQVYFPEGWYTFSHQAASTGFSLRLNGEQVVSGASSSGVTRYISEGSYAVVAEYNGAGGGHEVDVNLNWTWNGPDAASDCFPDRFTLDSPGHATTCQRFPFLAGDAHVAGAWVDLDLPSSYTMAWQGLVAFSSGTAESKPYRFHSVTPPGTEADVKVSHDPYTGAPYTGILEPVLPDSDLDGSNRQATDISYSGTRLVEVTYTLTPGKPAPRVWWEANDPAPLTPPVFLGARIDPVTGQQITLTWDRSLAGLPDATDPADFAVMRTGDAAGPAPITSVTAPSGAPNELQLNLSTVINEGETVTLRYLPAPYSGLVPSQAVPAARAANVALGKAAIQSSTNTYGPAGGVSGVKGVGAGFRTNVEPNPWWQVDLGDLYILQEIHLFNRSDGYQDAANFLKVMLSADGDHWTTVWANSGTLIGTVDTSPYVLDNEVAGLPARYVRLALESDTSLGLDEVEVYGLPALAPAVSAIPAFAVTRYADDGLDLIATTDGRPGQDGIRVYGDVVRLRYNRPLDPRSVPDPGDFTLLLGSDEVDVNQVQVDADVVTLYIARRLQEGDVVKLTYTPDDRPVRDQFGAQAPPLDNLEARLYIGDPPFNLALYKPATQSSTAEGDPAPVANRGIDGDRTTTAFSTADQRRPWWQVNLLGPYSLSRLVLFNTADQAALADHIQVAVSLDGETWRTIYQHDPATGGSGWPVLDLDLGPDPLVAQYVRVSLESATPTRLHLAEVEVYGTPAESVPRPVIAEASLHADVIRLVYDRALNLDSVPLPGDYSVQVNGAAAVVRATRILTDTVYLYLAQIVPQGADVYLSYTPSDTPVKDTYGATAQPLAGQWVQVESGMPPYNLALYQVATQSSAPEGESLSLNAAGGVDGDTTTSFHTTTQSKPWWKVDLGREAQLTQLVLYNNAAEAEQIQVWLSLDGVIWSKFYVHTAGAWTTLTIDLKGSIARYVRLSLDGTTDLELTEVRVFGVPHDR